MNKLTKNRKKWDFIADQDEHEFDDVAGVELEEDVYVPGVGHNHIIELDEDDEFNFNRVETKDERPPSIISDLKDFDAYRVSTETTWIHPDLLMEGSVTILVAAPGAGKSTLAVKLVNAVANGLPLLGHEHEPRPVLYLDRENPLGALIERRDWLKLKVGGNLKYFGMHAGEVPLPDDIEVIKWVNLQSKRPVIVIDSLVRFLAGGNENSSQDVNQFWNRILPLKAAGCSFLILHHTGKGETTQDGRGSLDILAGCDMMFKVSKLSKGSFLSKMQTERRRTRHYDAALPEKVIVHIGKDGEFSSNAAKSDEAVNDDLKELLEANPGVTMGKFVKMAKDLEITSAKKWLTAMVEGGFVVTDTNEDDVTMFTWSANGNVSDVSTPKPKKTSNLLNGMLGSISVRDVPEDEPVWRK